MPVITSYPGVYIEELHSLSLSVSTSATAVPVFAVGNGSKFTDGVRVSSWMDFQRKLDVHYPAPPVVDGTRRTSKDAEYVAADKTLYVSLRAYFENGGGYCYLVPVAKLIEQVPKLQDATTLVAAGQDITPAVANLCADGRCLFAILDGPDNDIDDGTSRAGQAYPESPYVAVYYPWLVANWTDVAIPPSAAMAGVYCKVDATRGVWKAPANIALQGGVMPQFAVTDDLQGQYTQENALNMIRVFNRGVATVWGARTRDDTDAWRYISVRRLFNSVQRDVKAAMQTAVFEPNSQPTWESVRASVNNYLYRLYRQGALAGTNESEAYFVQIGKDITMTQDEINQGKMIVKIGLAAVRPAEFIVLQFTQDMAE